MAGESQCGSSSAFSVGRCGEVTRDSTAWEEAAWLVGSRSGASK